MKLNKLEEIINKAFENKQKITPKSDKKILKAISETIQLLDEGKIRVANKTGDKWNVNQWIKKAILLSFRTNKMFMSKGPYTTWYDKVSGKSVNWKEKDWEESWLQTCTKWRGEKRIFHRKKCRPYALLCKSWRLCR